MELRQLTINDVDGLTQVEARCFSHPWSREAFWGELSANPVAHYFGCFHEGRLIAYAGVWLVVDEGHITNVAVDPDYRRQGIGELLMGAMIAWAEALGAAFLTLEVREGNAAARRLYDKLSFAPAGRRRDYYDDPKEDALLLTLSLSAGAENSL